jgi:hypothetical protein
LGEADQPSLHNIDGAALQGIKARTTSCKGLLWVTRGCAAELENPEMSLVSGFLRVLRSESVGHSFISLDLGPSQPTWSESAASAIVCMLKYGLAVDEDISSAAQENGFWLARSVNGLAGLLLRFVANCLCVCPITEMMRISCSNCASVFYDLSVPPSALFHIAHNVRSICKFFSIMMGYV